MKIRKSAKRIPVLDVFNGNFLKLGSAHSIALPINLIGWGNFTGSPIKKSSIKATGRIYHVEINIAGILFLFVRFTSALYSLTNNAYKIKSSFSASIEFSRLDFNENLINKFESP